MAARARTDAGRPTQKDRETAARDAVNVSKKERTAIQQHLTDRLHLTYRPGNDGDAMAKLLAQQGEALPEIVLFDRMVECAVAATPATRRADPSTRSCARGFVESQLHFHLLSLMDDWQEQEDTMLEHYDHDHQHRLKRESTLEREYDARDRKRRELREEAAAAGARGETPHHLARVSLEMGRLDRRMGRQEQALNGVGTRIARPLGRRVRATSAPRGATTSMALATRPSTPSRLSTGVAHAGRGAASMGADWAYERFVVRERVRERVERREAQRILKALSGARHITRAKDTAWSAGEMVKLSERAPRESEWSRSASVGPGV